MIKALYVLRTISCSKEITSNIRLRAILKNDSKKNKENKWDCKPQLSLEMKY